MLLTFLKGLAMGACDVIPGVSGGTIAFITGIYDRLITALHHFDIQAIKFLILPSSQTKGPQNKRLFYRLQRFRTHIDGTFLVTLFGGIIIAILTLAGLIKHLLLTYPQFVWSFFGGLLIASSIILARNIKQRNTMAIGMTMIGIGAGLTLTSLPLMQSAPSLFSTFIAGATAIIAMILPGISGSYILLISNHYYHILDVVHQFTIGFKSIIADIGHTTTILAHLPRGFLSMFILGIIGGLLTFSKVLHRLQRHHEQKLYAFLTGMIIGSLHLLRPWKETIKSYVDSHNNHIPLIQKKILRSSTSELLICGGLFIGGIVIIILIEYLHHHFTTKKQ